MNDLVDWTEPRAKGRIEDDDYHVYTWSLYQNKVAMMLVLRFSEHARAQCELAEEALHLARGMREHAIDRLRHLRSVKGSDWNTLREARAAVDEESLIVANMCTKASESLSYMMRTTKTLEHTIHILAMMRR